jgi:hypothetical protein
MKYSRLFGLPEKTACEMRGCASVLVFPESFDNQEGFGSGIRGGGHAALQ